MKIAVNLRITLHISMPELIFLYVCKILPLIFSLDYVVKNLDAYRNITLKFLFVLFLLFKS